MNEPTMLRDGTVTYDRRLDALPQFDARNENFSIRALLATGAKPRSYTWSCKPWLDQGPDGACVGFSMAHELAARPAVIPNMDYSFAKERIYWEAQRIDEWEGGSYPGAVPRYEGTSVLAGAKVLMKLGYLKEYRWAFDLNDLVLAIGYKGPAILGVDWYEGFMHPAADGELKMTGSIVGRHAILANKVDVKRRRMGLHQSWGQPEVWAKAWMSFDTVSSLLGAQWGEACIPVMRSTKAA